MQSALGNRNGRGGKHLSASVLALALLPWISAAGDMPHGFREPEAYILQVNGQVIASRAPGKPHQPASLAKLAAALTALDVDREVPGILDRVAVVSKRAAAAPGARIGLHRGDRILARDLLTAMMVGSANDACIALAEHVSVTVEGFTDKMNEDTRRIGMTGTMFIDPCGFDRQGQRTTAEDMLILASAAILRPDIIGITSQESAGMATVGNKRSFIIHTTNALLSRYQGVFGLKTGHTAQAGPCLIAAARSGSNIAVAVLLGARDRWPFAAALLDQAFDRVSDMPRVRERSAIGYPYP